MQAVCGSNLQVLNIVMIVARWPGSVHNARIFYNSHMCAKFERGDISGISPGDSGCDVYKASQSCALLIYNINLASCNRSLILHSITSLCFPTSNVKSDFFKICEKYCLYFETSCAADDWTTASYVITSNPH